MRRKQVLRAAIVAAVLPTTLLQPVVGDPNAPPADPAVRLSRAQASSFTDALAALARQGHTLIVAEGQPLHLTLTPDQARKVQLDPPGQPLSVLVQTVAAAYDYDAERSGAAFLLRKRYTDVDDLPDVTLQECAQDVADALRFTARSGLDLSPDAGHIGPVKVRSDLQLTPEQLKAVTGDPQGVPVAALPADQQQALQQFLARHTGHTDPAFQREQLAFLESVAKDDPRFCWHDVHVVKQLTLKGFGFERPAATDIVGGLPTPRFSLLIQPGGREGRVVGPSGDGTMFPLDSQGNYAPALGPDPTDPPPTALASPPPPLLGPTLGQIVARLAARAPAGSPPLAVEDCLAPKRAAVFGEQYAAPAQEMRALAGVYGLDVRPEDPYGLRTPGQAPGRLLLARPAPAQPTGYAGLAAAIRRVLPQPLLRALAAHPTDLRAAAIQEIRTATDPRIKKAPDGRVALSSLGEREREALAGDAVTGFGERGRGDADALR